MKKVFNYSPVGSNTCDASAISAQPTLLSSSTTSKRGSEFLLVESRLLENALKYYMYIFIHFQICFTPVEGGEESSTTIRNTSRLIAKYFEQCRT